MDYIAGLIELHRGLPRQGPGDLVFASSLLARLPPLPARPRIADLGCGSGAGTLLLARHFRTRVRAVDASAEFIEALKLNAQEAGLDALVEPICADMAKLDWPRGSIDLLWSEGAAYSIGFENALRVWRPLMAPRGVAVVSELSWFEDRIPDPLRSFWEDAYPGIGDEDQNRQRAEAAGYEMAFTQRLPSAAWWTGYYDALKQRLRDTEPGRIPQAVLDDTRKEMSLFEQYSDFYGYTFYVLVAAGSDAVADADSGARS
ncbi:MAG: methyltransferase domain-containing protein [Gammaproteobacteria bacterium]|nr:methyltransferase domain-containing protein [Gammaproteobacteria bacterium]